jgi:hypothetical protein
MFCHSQKCVMIYEFKFFSNVESFLLSVIVTVTLVAQVLN